MFQFYVKSLQFSIVFIILNSYVILTEATKALVVNTLT